MVALEHVPERPRQPRLMITDAGIDQDVVMRRPDDEGLDAEDQTIVGGIEEGRLEPSTVLVEQLLGQSREKSQSFEPGALLFDDRINGDVVQGDRSRHRTAVLLESAYTR